MLEKGAKDYNSYATMACIHHPSITWEMINLGANNYTSIATKFFYTKDTESLSKILDMGSIDYGKIMNNLVFHKNYDMIKWLLDRKPCWIDSSNIDVKE